MKLPYLALLVIIGLVEFARGGLIVSLLPTYLPHELGYSMALVGFAVSAQYVCDTVFKTPAGYLSDRFGPRTVLLAGLALSALALVILYRARDPGDLVAAAGLFGLGASPVWPAVISGATHLNPAHKRATVMGSVFIGWIVGGGSGPILTNFFLGRTAGQAFALLGAAVLAGLLLAAVLVRGPGLHGTRRRFFQAPIREQFRVVLRDLRGIHLLFPAMFLQTLAVGILIPVLIRYARDYLHLSHALFAYLLIAGAATMALLLIPLGRLADHVRHRPLLVTGFLLSAPLLVALIYTRSLPAIFGLVMVIAACYSLILPAWNSLLTKAVPGDKRGMLMAVFMTVEGMGLAVGAAAGGELWASVSPQTPFLVCAGVLAVMGVFYLLFPLEQAVALREV